MAGRKKELSEREVAKRIWSNPGGEELALREAKTGTDADVDDQSDAVARETPKSTLWRISDPSPGTSATKEPAQKKPKKDKKK